MGGVCAVASMITDTFAKVISTKVSKHEQTVAVCHAKLNTVKDICSKALTDNKISHDEFLMIKSEIEKYNQMRQSIRNKYKT